MSKPEPKMGSSLTLGLALLTRKIPKAVVYLLIKPMLHYEVKYFKEKEYIDLSWYGCYTFGFSYFRGSRVGIYGARHFNVNQESSQLVECKTEEPTSLALRDQHEHIPYASEGTPPDCFKEIYSRSQIMNKLWEAYDDYIWTTAQMKQLLPETGFYWMAHEKGFGWSDKDITHIRAELAQVQEYGEEQGIKFEWI